MARRRQIGNSVRFEVFKRDGFVCQYCGAHPPEAILHVDHIVPVSRGGGNEQDNLITACNICNAGKAARSLDSIPQSLKDKAMEIKEREKQINGYSQIMRQKRERLESEAWEVAHIFLSHFERDAIRRDWLHSIKKFIEKLGVNECIVSIESAIFKRPTSESNAFRYFCGICWKKIKESDNG